MSGWGRCGPKAAPDALVQGERIPERVEPAVDRHGVLGEEADQVAGRALGAEVAGAAVAEVLGRDLDHLGSGGAGDFAGAVARARVDHDQLGGALGDHGRQHLLEPLLPVLHRDDYGQRVRHARTQPPLERLQRAYRAEQHQVHDPPDGRGHYAVQVEWQAVRPVGALLRRCHGGLRLGRTLGQLALQLVDARTQLLELGGHVRGAPQFAATRG